VQRDAAQAAHALGQSSGIAPQSRPRGIPAQPAPPPPAPPRRRRKAAAPRGAGPEALRRLGDDPPVIRSAPRDGLISTFAARPSSIHRRRPARSREPPPGEGCAEAHAGVECGDHLVRAVSHAPPPVGGALPGLVVDQYGVPEAPSITSNSTALQPSAAAMRRPARVFSGASGRRTGVRTPADRKKRRPAPGGPLLFQHARPATASSSTCLAGLRLPRGGRVPRRRLHARRHGGRSGWPTTPVWPACWSAWPPRPGCAPSRSSAGRWTRRAGRTVKRQRTGMALQFDLGFRRQQKLTNLAIVLYSAGVRPAAIHSEGPSASVFCGAPGMSSW